MPSILAKHAIYPPPLSPNPAQLIAAVKDLHKLPEGLHSLLGDFLAVQQAHVHIQGSVSRK